MQRFVGEIGAAIAAAFDSEQYRERVESLQEEEKHREEAALRQLGDDSQKTGVALLRTPQGFVFAPMKDAEETYSHEEFAQLPEERQEELGKQVSACYEKLHKLMNEFPRWRRDAQGVIKQVGSEALRLAVGHLIEEIKPGYGDLPDVISYLDAVMRDIIESGKSLHESTKSDEESETTFSPARSRFSVTWSICWSKIRPAARARSFMRTIRPCRIWSGASSTTCTWAPCSAISR